MAVIITLKPLFYYFSDELNWSLFPRLPHCLIYQGVIIYRANKFVTLYLQNNDTKQWKTVFTQNFILQKEISW